MSVEYIKRALEASGLSQRELSLATGAYLERPGHDQSLINKILKGNRALKSIELKVVERLTRLEMETLIEMSTIGLLNHGSQVQAQQGVANVEPPRNVTPQTAAIRVNSDDFFPIWEKDSILYFTMGKPPAPAINKRCVVKEARNGSLYVGILRPETSPNYFRIQSVHGRTPDIADVVVEWASPIEWVKTP